MAPRIAHRAALLVKTDALREARRVAGPDGRLSNAGKRGARLSVTWRQAPNATSVLVRAVPPGPWRWVTDGTKPHLIGVGRANKRTGNYAASRFGRSAGGRGRKLRPLAIDGVGPRMPPAAHPGTAGKGAWRKVEARAPQALRKAGAVEVGRFVRG